MRFNKLLKFRTYISIVITNILKYFLETNKTFIADFNLFTDFYPNAFFLTILLISMLVLAFTLHYVINAVD